MVEMQVLDQKNLDIPLNTRIPKHTIAYYRRNNKSKKYIYFTKEKLLLVYHLNRFSFFDREIADNIYMSLTGGKKIANNWFSSLVGGDSTYPFSVHPTFKDSKKTVYYINRRFSKWVIATIKKFPPLSELTRVTEYTHSLYSIETNNLYGGKPKTVNIHDLNARRYASRIAVEITQRCSHLSSDELNIQYAFPSNRKAITLLPDAALFVCGKVFYLEYDRNTEAHYQLLGKIIAYFSEKHYKHSRVCFIFDNLGKKYSEGDYHYDMNPRVVRFIQNIESKFYRETDKTFYDFLRGSDVSVLATPSVHATSQIAYYILDVLGLAPPVTNDMLVNAPYDVLDVVEAEKDSPFDVMLKVYNDFFEEIEIPVIRSPYVLVGIDKWLDNLYNEYHEQYDHIAIAFDKEVTSQYYPLPHNNYFTGFRL